MPISPPDGHAFSWEEVEASGVRLIVQAPPGLPSVQAEVSRDPGLVSYGDFLSLYESSPGRYEGTALRYVFDPADEVGPYYWHAYYDQYNPGTFSYDRIAGLVHSFSIRPPYRSPRLSIATRSRPFLGQRYRIVLNYRPGSDPQADRLHVLVTEDFRCPTVPGDDPSGLGRTLVADALPPASGELETAVRHRQLGVLRVCAYVTSNGNVTKRASRRVEVVRPPVPKRQMLRWRMSPRGLGPMRIGMTVAEIERVTGRTMLHGYGDYSSCQQWSLAGAPGLSLMRAYGRLARIDAWRGRWRSSRGIRIGDPEAKVRRRYGNVRSQPHPYTPPGKYLIVGGPKRRMIFETNPAGKVTSFRGGRRREVGYIEGCV
jgi:hypothetical protein